jgi:hypothetical protein
MGEAGPAQTYTKKRRIYSLVMNLERMEDEGFSSNFPNRLKK